MSAGAVAGITSVLLVMLMSQPRIFFAMSRDQLLPAGREQGPSAVRHALHHDDHHRRHRRDIRRAVTKIEVVGEMTSIGTLFAFVVVCAAVIILRVKRPEAQRPFRVPGGYVFPVLGVLSCLYLMVSLSVVTWVRFLVWLELRPADLLVLRPHAQPAAQPGRGRRPQRLREVRQRLHDARLLVLFNGLFMALLGCSRRSA